MTKLNIKFTEESLKIIKDLSDESNMDISKFIRNAIRVYGALKRETRKGKRIYIGTERKREKEILIP